MVDSHAGGARVGAAAGRSHVRGAGEDVDAEIVAAPAMAAAPARRRATRPAGGTAGTRPERPVRRAHHGGRAGDDPRPPAAGRPPGFRPADEELDGYVILDFDGFDAWYEEDERNVGHPHDPFHRIDIVHSSATSGSSSTAASSPSRTRPKLLFEPLLPGPLLPAGRGRADGTAPAERHDDVLRLQGRGVALGARAERVTSHGRVRRHCGRPTRCPAAIAFYNERVDVFVETGSARAPGHAVVALIRLPTLVGRPAQPARASAADAGGASFLCDGASHGPCLRKVT